MHIRSLVLSFSLLVITFYNQSEPETIDSLSLKLNGLSFFLKKEVILSNFGKPTRIFEPKYECGYLSEEEQGNNIIPLITGT
jgi:hypothetical protein